MEEPKIVSVQAREDYRLLLHYDTGEQKIFDVSPYIKGSWFGQLRDVAYFKQVRIISHGEGIVWPEGQDLAPHELYELSVAVETQQL